MAKKTAIKNISALEILDSRGIPTLKAGVVLADGSAGEASVPSGTSSGKSEAYELRDGDMSRFGGRGVRKAVGNATKVIFPKLKGKDANDQRNLDQIMLDLDGTDNKSRLGANAILGVSLACARAAAVSSKLPLYRYLAKTFKFKVSSSKFPRPMFNLLNGGLHADSGMDIQEFLFIPKNGNFEKALQHAAEMFYQLRRLIALRRLETGVGFEGGFEPKLRGSGEALDLLSEAARAAKVPPEEINFGLDVAASALYDAEKSKRYVFKREKADFSREQLVGWYGELLRRYPLISIEDGLEENDWEGWKHMFDRLGGKALVIGDDFIVTNPARLLRAIREKSINGVIIKPNQIGTLSETLTAVKLAQQNGIKVVISHRSGDTEDAFIADLAVAVGADFIKTGAVSRGERVAKYNRLLEIAKELK